MHEVCSKGAAEALHTGCTLAQTHVSQLSADWQLRSSACRLFSMSRCRLFLRSRLLACLTVLLVRSRPSLGDAFICDFSINGTSSYPDQLAFSEASLHCTPVSPTDAAAKLSLQVGASLVPYSATFTGDVKSVTSVHKGQLPSCVFTFSLWLFQYRRCLRRGRCTAICSCTD